MASTEWTRHLADRERICLELSSEVLAAVDRIKGEVGLRSRAGLIERLLEEIILSGKEEEAGHTSTSAQPNQ